MEIMVIASTKPYEQVGVGELTLFGGKLAGICYMNNEFEDIVNEDVEKTLKRAKMTLDLGHHSIYDHLQFTLLLKGIPKIIAMILNNEKFYTTSEKSARYTRMSVSGVEEALYNKWFNIVKELIHKAYPDMHDKLAEKLAMENARYMISVFTPTTLAYTTSLRQLNYIIRMMESFVDTWENTDFYIKVKDELKKFIKAIKDMGLYVEGLDYDGKGRKLSLFGNNENEKELFGDVYSAFYDCSFAMLAQAQRHRTLWYTMKSDGKNNKFFVPLIVEVFGKDAEWLRDISSIAELYPQGTLVRVNERGTKEAFLLKCTERLCGKAQWEIMKNTAELYNKYMDSIGEPAKYAEARCRLFKMQCKDRCFFGSSLALYRII
jgi:thymidylate synthase ThyX